MWIFSEKIQIQHKVWNPQSETAQSEGYLYIRSESGNYTRSDVGRPKMTRSYILARKIPWFFILPKINFKLSKVQTLQSMESWLQVIFRFFSSMRNSVTYSNVQNWWSGQGICISEFSDNQSISRKKWNSTDMSVWGMSVLLDELVRHLSISTKKGIANFVNAELAQRNCQTDQFFKLWERHFSKFQKLCSTKMFI